MPATVCGLERSRQNSNAAYSVTALRARSHHVKVITTVFLVWVALLRRPLKFSHDPLSPFQPIHFPHPPCVFPLAFLVKHFCVVTYKMSHLLQVRNTRIFIPSCFLSALHSQLKTVSSVVHKSRHHGTVRVFICTQQIHCTSDRLIKMAPRGTQLFDNDGNVIFALVYMKYEDISAFSIKTTIFRCWRHMLW